MKMCCDSGFFGGIGIGRLSDFCRMTGVEAQMTTCRCGQRRQGGSMCSSSQFHGGSCDNGCGYTTTSDCGRQSSDGCGCR